MTPDLVAVEAGATFPISVLIENKEAEVDRYEMEVEGIDPEWKAVPVPIFTLDPSESRTEKIFFKPPRASESSAGNYPFVLTVRSLNSGESKTVQGILTVKPFNHLSMEISPKKGFVSPTKKQNTFSVAIVNLGNVEHTVQLVGNDPEDACSFGFEHEQVTVGAGQQREVEVVANPSNPPLFSNGRLIGFSVTARSTETPSVVASAQAQLEQRSLFSPATVGLAALIAIIVALWILMAPKPPGISLTISQSDGLVGDKIQISWKAHDASNVRVTMGSGVVYEGDMLQGSKTIPLAEAGTIAIHAEASKDGRKSEVATQVMTVTEPTKSPDPEIATVKATPTRVKLGDPFTLYYKFNAAVTKAVVGPDNKDLDLQLEKIDLVPPAIGSREYTIVAYNKEGKSVKKSFTVEVYEESDATILSFTASPTEASEDGGGRVSLTWQITNSARNEFKQDGDVAATVVNPSDSRDVVVTKTSKFILTAIDAKGRKKQQSIIVKYKSNPNPPTEPPTTADTGTTATTGTTAGGPTTAGTTGNH